MSNDLNASTVKEPNLLSEQEYIEELLWIKTKSLQLVPLWLNSTQRYLLEVRRRLQAAKLPIRYIVLKYRQGGVTTFEQAVSFQKVATVPGYRTVTLAHDLDTTEEVFEIATRFYEHLDPAFRPNRKTVNARRLVFPDLIQDGRKLESNFGIATAGSREFGHGRTIQRVHCTEVARWPDPETIMTGLGEAVPAHGEIVLESTPKGAGTWFHELWREAKAGKNEFLPVFFPWYYDRQYQEPLLPGEKLEYTDEERRLVQRHHLTPEQVKWRRAKKRRLKHKFPEQYPEDDASCFLAAGHCVFLPDALEHHASTCCEPIEVIRGSSGEVRIWEQVIPGAHYVAGADVAEGLPHGDKSCGVVFHRNGCRQVATIHGNMKPRDLALGLNTLGRRYNDALLAVEKNNHGGTTLDVLQHELQYPNLYHMPDPQTEKARCLGWDTNTRSRPMMMDDLVEAVDDQHVVIRDKEIVGELYSFVRNIRGKEEAQQGCNDDLVLALAIMLQARRVRVPQYAFNVVQPRRDLGQGRGF